MCFFRIYLFFVTIIMTGKHYSLTCGWMAEHIIHLRLVYTGHYLTIIFLTINYGYSRLANIGVSALNV